MEQLPDPGPISEYVVIVSDVIPTPEELQEWEKIPKPSAEEMEGLMQAGQRRKGLPG